MNFQFKNDEYRKARGNRTKLVNLFCRVCKTHIMVYQKDDYPGRLRRLYFDRIFWPTKLANLKDLSTIPILLCHSCKEDLGTAYIYKKENRMAFKVYQDALYKEPRKLRE